MFFKTILAYLAKIGLTNLVIGSAVAFAGTGAVLVTTSVVYDQTQKNKSEVSAPAENIADQQKSSTGLPESVDTQSSTPSQKKSQPSTQTKQKSNSSDNSGEPASASTDDHSSGSSPSQSTSSSTPSSSSSSSPSSSSGSSSTPSSSTPADTCGNDVGNGNDIVSGPSGPSGGDNDRPFRSLTVHPSDPNTVIVGTERNGFLKTTNGGSSWTRLRKGVRHIDNIGYPEVWDMAMASSNTSVIYAASLDSPGPVTGSSYPSSMAGIYKTTDSGSSWSRKNCGIINSRITSIAVSSSDANTVVAGIEGGSPSFSDPPASYYNGGIFYTTDGGENWKAGDVPGDETTNGFWHMKRRGSTYYTFAMNYDDLSKNLGFLKSSDNGKNWTAFGSVLKNLRIAEFDVSADGQTMYAVPRDSQQVKKSIDGGSNWTTIDTNATGPIAVSPSDANLIVVANCCLVYRSTDGLTSETKIFDLNKVHEIVFAPSDSTIVWLINEGYAVYKSTDSGATFSLIKNLRSDVLNTNP